jgi:signal transduction histidine kinase
MSNLSQKLASLAPKKLAAVVFLSITAAATIAMSVLYATAVAQKDTALRHHVRDLTVAAAALVDVEGHEQLREPGEFRSERYWRVSAPLVQMHREHPSIQYLWTVRLTEKGEQVFVLETSADDGIRAQQQAAGRSQDLLPFLGPNTETPRGWESIPTLRNGRPVVFPGIYEDEHGAYIEARAPLRDRAGRFIGYVGIDYALDSYRRQLNEVRLAGALSLLLALLISFVIARSSLYMRQQSLAYLAAAEEQRDLARKAEAAKGHLLAVATHDLKNPLSAIAGISGLWLQQRKAQAKADPAEEAEMLETIHTSARHMSEIVRGILVNEGIEQGGLPFEPKPSDLTTLAGEVLRFNAPAAARKSITLDAALEPGLRATVDPRGMRECFDNYVSNAVKFSPPGRNVTVSLRRGPGPGEFEFAVQDQGPGLKPEDHARLFGKFARLSARPTGGEVSTGLGLSIVKAVADLHGGSVGCDSEPGRGARFWLRCPFEPRPATSRSPGPAGPAA